MKRILGMLMLACALVACSDDEPAGPGGNTGPYHVVNVFPKLTFSRPTDVENAGDGSGRVFVTEQTGRILVFPGQSSAAASKVFLDISSEVLYENQSEMGLLGLAFHPHYEANGYFYVAYTAGTPASHSERISRFKVSLDADVADPASEKILYDFPDAFPNHNGGALAFGPDGYLYIAIGDEGGAGDTNNNAQDRSRIFGKILRIDVNQNVNTPPYYGIPADNPYVGNVLGYREDIWAYGFRNPWRMSFHPTTGDLIAGDVGEKTWEEVDIVKKGRNYGWDCREGLVAYDEHEDSSSALCATAGPFEDPILVYSHADGDRSITGGYVYRNLVPPLLTGQYIYADFYSGRIWALNLVSHASMLLADTNMFISTFGVTEDGQVLIAAYFADGTPTALYRLAQGATP